MARPVGVCFLGNLRLVFCFLSCDRILIFQKLKWHSNVYVLDLIYTLWLLLLPVQLSTTDNLHALATDNGEQLRWKISPACFLPESLRGAQMTDLKPNELDVCVDLLPDERHDAASTAHNFLMGGTLYSLTSIRFTAIIAPTKTKRRPIWMSASCRISADARSLLFFFLIHFSTVHDSLILQVI